MWGLYVFVTEFYAPINFAASHLFCDAMMLYVSKILDD